jgi:hypothetical protein
MKTPRLLALGLTALILFSPQLASAGAVSTAADSVGTAIINKFGRGVAGATGQQVSEATERVVERYGAEALPLLKNAGHDGFRALSEAGEQAPKIIRLYASKGDEALWVISDTRRLALFLKHGDSAASALSKHPGIADSLIERFGDDAVAILQNGSRQSAQRFSMLAEDGLLTASARNSELLSVLRRYGDPAMDFIWKNKGALAVASVMTTFLLNPQAFISGATALLIPAVEEINWTLIISGLLAIGFLPKVLRAILGVRNHRNITRKE